jgi:hypothetical protein
MSSPCLYMDHPEWTPEQRIAVTLAAVLLLKNPSMAISTPAAHQPTESRRWGALSAPVDPDETMRCMRAQSILTGSLIAGDLCPSGACPPLTLDQANDVLAWYRPDHG